MYMALFLERDGFEVSAPSYSRIPISRGMFVQDKYRPCDLVLDVALRFHTAEEDWGVIGAMGIFREQAGGEALLRGRFSRANDIARDSTMWVERGRMVLNNFNWPSE